MLKEMVVYYGSDLLPYKDKDLQVHYPIIGGAFQGASQTNFIKFYIDNIDAQTDTPIWLAVCKLPNGQVGYTRLDSNTDDDGTYVTLTLTRWHTQYEGNLFVNLQCYGSGVEFEEGDDGLMYPVGVPVVQVTGSVKMYIAYATGIVDGGDIDVHTLQELIAYINNYLRKDSEKYMKVISSISNRNNSEYAEYLKDGDIVYSIANCSFYTLSGTHPSLSYAEITFEFGGLKLGSLEVSSSLKVYTFADIVNDDGLTLPEMVAAYIAAADDTYVTLTTEQVITGKKTFTGLNVYKTGDTLYGNVMPSTSGYTANRTLATENYVTDYAYSKSQVYTKEETYAKEDVYTKAQTYSQAQVDEIVASIKANQFKVVDSLPPVGENGIIYLVPISGGQGYTQYIWQSGSYISLGDTTVDLSNYYTQAQTNSLLAQKQDDVCLSIVSGKLCITYVE